MAWYRRSKLGLDMIRNLALGSKQPFNCGKVLTSCLDDVSKKSSWGLKCYYVLAVMGVAASGGYLSHVETIPYSRRTHLVLLPMPLEKALSDLLLQHLKKEHEGKVLPATHPMSLRVGLIAKNIIDALQRDLSGGGHNHYVDVWGYWKLGNIKSRAARYLEHVNWQVVLVEGVPGPDGPIFCGAGKIVVYAGLLEDLNSDAEIAALIAREVAGSVARTAAELVTKIATAVSYEVLFDLLFGKSAMREKIAYLFVYSPLCRKLELEADYIGLLLMASAGYDPRVGVKLMEKEAKCGAEDNSYWAGLFETYPSPKKRLQNVSQAQDEAMNFYMKRRQYS